MIPDIGIFAPDFSKTELLSRLEVSDGTIAVEKLTYLRQDQFEPGAMLPKSWRSIAEHEYRQFVKVSAPPRELCVGLIKIGEDPFMALKSLQMAATATIGVRPAVIHRKAEVAQLLAFLNASGFWDSENPIQSVHLSSGIPNSEHSTRKSSYEEEMVGLHFDSWDRLSPLTRWRGANRICVNLNEGDRAFQFVPISARLAAAMLLTQGIDVENNEAHNRDRTGRINFGRRFLEMYPNAPVIRLRIRRGEAYIAPTENIMHDGSAFLERGRDTTLTVRGFFKPCGR